MRLPPAVIELLVPRDLPPGAVVPLYAQELAYQIDSELLRRSYLWSTALTAAAIQAFPIRCTHFSAGFVHVNPDVLQESEWLQASLENFVFGGYALVDPAVEGIERQMLIRINVGDTAFPIVLTPGAYEPHGCPPHPHTGSATCWVKNQNLSGRWQEGILTCRHVVVGFQRGQRLSFQASASHSSPTTGLLADIDACTIDAAIVGIAAGDWPTGLSALPVRSPAAPGMTAQFDGRMTAASGSVLRIFHYAPYFGNLFGQRVVADFHGTNGDSGSLLTSASGTEGIGIYMGTIPDGSGGSDGIYQDLDQVVRYFKLDLYI